MSESLLQLDVRPILKAGGEPFGEIMRVTASLASGQGLCLLAPFKPVPLFSVMEGKGYTHTEKELGGGDWEIIFMPHGGGAAAPPGAAADTDAAPPEPAGWPAPSQRIDLRGMPPPEPLVLTLETVEALAVGEVMEGCYDRDPVLLYPELDTRGHHYQSEKRSASEYRVRIRRGGSQEQGS